ncbi:MAG: ribbon-helix-helix domain-containing protein [Chloroflexota bacterium]
MERVSINLRLPGELHAALKSLAEDQERSLQQQIIYLLRQALRDHQSSDSSTPEAPD